MLVSDWRHVCATKKKNLKLSSHTLMEERIGNIYIEDTSTNLIENGPLYNLMSMMCLKIITLGDFDGSSSLKKLEPDGYLQWYGQRWKDSKIQ